MQEVLDMVQKNRETGINRSLVIRLYEHILLGGVTFTHKLLAGGAAVDIDYITGAPHEMDTTPAGSDAIRDMLLTRCVPLP